MPRRHSQRVTKNGNVEERVGSQLVKLNPIEEK
jgi:hypothetical protein